MSETSSSQRALLLIDLQNDFLPGGALPTPHGDEVIRIANEVQPYFERILASQDWHPPHHMSFAATHRKPVGERIPLEEGGEQILWPVHCVAESWGAAFPAALHVEHVEKIFKKGVDPQVDSYSAFFDHRHQRSTGLDSYLREEGINHLYCMGLATDYCVEATVCDGCALGLTITVIVDGCRAINLHPGDGDAALKRMVEAGAQLITSKELGQQGERAGATSPSR